MKIAIVGTAPQFIEAPFNDPSWEIWTVAGLFNKAPRIDRLFELHNKKDMAEFVEAQVGYTEYAKGIKDKLVLRESHETYPDATVFDFKYYLNKYGPRFASSISWMLAEAIEKGATEIGIFGVNMTHDSEYEYQRPSACYFCGIAVGMGIKIHIPKSSDLLLVPVQYGYEDEPLAVISARQKKAEAIQNIQIASDSSRHYEGDKRYYEGVRDAFENFERSWIR